MNPEECLKILDAINIYSQLSFHYCWMITIL
jgi:hypothetical protein